MSTIQVIESVSAYNKLRGVETFHPLISVFDAATAKPMPSGNYNIGLYGIFLKELKCGELKYGRNKYDYQEGTLVFTGPGQVIGVPENTNKSKPKGWTIVFHPDLIKGSTLSKEINSYHFFSYDVNEALHISEKERKIIIDQCVKIQSELENAIDHHSKKIICSNLSLLLSYFSRFYDRQFITREQSNKSVIEQFDSLLQEYYNSSKPSENGIPSVSFFAKELHLSPNYLGDLLKRETGMSPIDHIQLKVLDIAKEKIFDSRKSITEIGYELGFKYPQHFTRLFKLKTGYTPKEYRQLN